MFRQQGGMGTRAYPDLQDIHRLESVIGNHAGERWNGAAEVGPGRVKEGFGRWPRSIAAIPPRCRALGPLVGHVMDGSPVLAACHSAVWSGPAGTLSLSKSPAVFLKNFGMAASPVAETSNAS